MDIKHTPGPWHVIDGGRHWNNPDITNYRIHAPTSEHGFNVAYSEHGELVAEHVYEEADAHLIAASPDLLEALQYALPYLERGELGMARAAIARATGAQS